MNPSKATVLRWCQSHQMVMRELADGSCAVLLDSWCSDEPLAHGVTWDHVLSILERKGYRLSSYAPGSAVD